MEEAPWGGLGALPPGDQRPGPALPCSGFILFFIVKSIKRGGRLRELLMLGAIIAVAFCLGYVLYQNGFLVINAKSAQLYMESPRFGKKRNCIQAKFSACNGVIKRVIRLPQGEKYRFVFRLSKKWLAPLFRGVHSSLAPTARPGSYARKPLLRKAFCGFDAHVAKSDQSLRGLRPPNPRGFFDRLCLFNGPDKRKGLH